ncbi:ferredoxin--NADP reductase [Halococcoides cellulosivorans]|uniref:Oxidoreductase n=1 Tax=Halococcoides cellulosivorans TaxID=1679096 RepID=A0A2R4X107_9EURY|nr:FAD-binding oxidoreductase [Halococcoides cellulosivorans]AWB27433.1 oxidoreductase [Halococcoides cellulosivorans]
MDHESTQISAVESVGPDAVAVTIDTPDGFDAAPGQFVSLSVPESDESRFYTVSSPSVTETFEVTLTIDPDGTLAPLIAERAVGDSIEVAGPFGDAHYDGQARPLVLASGPGVGPAVAIAERAHSEGADPAIVYRDATVIHSDRLDTLADAGVPVVILDADADLRDPVATALDRDPDVVFVYGFAAFIDDVEAAVAAADADPADVRVENFG